MLATRRTDGGIRSEVGRIRAASKLCRAGPPARAARRTRGREMTRQSPRRSVLRMLLSALTQKAPERAKRHVQPPRRPVGHDWESLGQPWRTELEIDTKRQQELE